MSWAINIKLNQIYTALKALQVSVASSVKNPMIASLSAGGYNITSVGTISGTTLSFTNASITNLTANLSTGTYNLTGTGAITATTGNFNNIVLPLPASYSITLIVGNFTISVPVRLNLTVDPFYTVGQEVIISGASPYNGTYIIQAVNGSGSYDLSTNPSGSSSPVYTGSVKLNAGNFTCQNLTTTNATVGTLTFPDASSQTTANDVYINGTTANVYYPMACVGTSTTGRTSLYTDGVGHITYNPTSNTLNINNNGKITLNGASALFQNTTASLTYRVPSTFKHSFEVVSTEIAKVDGTGLNVSATKTITLNGNSSTSTLEMSNTTGVLKLQNNNNSNSYEVPTSQIHSFKVNAVETASIDLNGIVANALSIGTFGVGTGTTVAFNTTASSPYTTTYLLPTNSLSIMYACIPKPTQTNQNWFALTVVVGNSIGAAFLFYPLASNNMVLGYSGQYTTISTPLLNISATVMMNIIKLV
jgi:hypothetical protein